MFENTEQIFILKVKKGSEKKKSKSKKIISDIIKEMELLEVPFFIMKEYDTVILLVNNKEITA